jgi:hypothetical protein
MIIMLKIFMITTRVEGDTTKLREELSKNKNVQVLEYYSEKDYLHTLLSKESFDLIITFDLAGFEQTTLMGGISYNLLNSKFVNFLLHENLQNEKCLSKQLSLSMFFYCAGSQYEKYLRENYPDIPYLRSLDEAASSMEVALKTAVDEVLVECHLR